MSELIELAPPRGALIKNVIFFHGLDGDSRATWTSPPPPENNIWPKWLAEDFEGLSVWSVGYDAPASNWRGFTMDLSDRAANVLSLLLVRPELREGELIFIGHSLGGLVIKQILRKASDMAHASADARNFVNRIRKVIFLATPHVGADLADWGDWLRVLFRPSAAMRALLRNDSHLRDLNCWYRTWAAQHNIDHLILFETKTTSLFGMVVKPDSSDPGLAANPIPIDADHVSIAKPANRESELYQLVKAFIERKVERPVSIEERKIDQVREDTRAIRMQREEGTLDKLFDWEASFERLHRRFGALGAVLLTFLIAVVLVWWNWVELKRRPGVEWVVAHLIQRTFSVPTDQVSAANKLKEAEDKQQEGQNAEAEQAYDEALKLYEQIGDPRGQANVLTRRGDFERKRRKFDKAREAYDFAVKLFKDHHDPLGEADVQHALGDLHRNLGQNPEALASYHKALGVFETSNVNDPAGLAKTYSGIGALERKLGHAKNARDAYTEARRLYDRLNNEPGKADVNHGLGDLESMVGNTAQAETHYDEALRLYQKRGDPHGEAKVYSGKGDLALKLGNTEKARQDYESARSRFESADDPGGQGDVWRGLGDLALKLGDAEEAERDYDKALGFYEKFDDHRGQGDVWRGRGNLALKLGKTEEAEKAYDKALGFYEQFDDQRGEAHALRALGDLQRNRGNIEKARKFYDKAILLYQKSEMAEDAHNTSKDLEELNATTRRR